MNFSFLVVLILFSGLINSSEFGKDLKNAILSSNTKEQDKIVNNIFTLWGVELKRSNIDRNALLKILIKNKINKLDDIQKIEACRFGHWNQNAAEIIIYTKDNRIINISKES